MSYKLASESWLWCIYLGRIIFFVSPKYENNLTQIYFKIAYREKMRSLYDPLIFIALQKLLLFNFALKLWLEKYGLWYIWLHVDNLVEDLTAKRHFSSFHSFIERNRKNTIHEHNWELCCLFFRFFKFTERFTYNVYVSTLIFTYMSFSLNHLFALLETDIKLYIQFFVLILSFIFLYFLSFHCFYLLISCSSC